MRSAQRARPITRRIVRPTIFIVAVAITLVLVLWLGIRSLFPHQPWGIAPIGGSTSGRAEQARIWAEEVQSAKLASRRPNAALRPAQDGSPMGQNRPGAEATGNTRPTGSKFRL